jgi:hypothetical protein
MSNPITVEQVNAQIEAALKKSDAENLEQVNTLVAQYFESLKPTLEAKALEAAESKKLLKKKINTPEKFDGSRDPTHNKVRNFISQCELFFHNHPAYLDDSDKIDFASSYCTGDAYTFISSYKSLPNFDDTLPENLWLSDWSKFKEKFEAVFGDVDRVATDARRLALLKQTSSVSDYATSFHRYSVTLGWNDQALRFHFYQGLKDHVKDELAKEDECLSLTELIELATKIDNRWHLRNRERRNHQDGRPALKGYVPSRLTLPRPQVSRSPAQNSSNHNWSPAIPVSDRMQIDANRRTPFVLRGPLTQEEKDRRRRLNLCNYCGLAGHIVQNCPKVNQAQDGRRPPPRRPERAQAAATFTISSANGTPLGQRQPTRSTKIQEE